MIGAISKAWPAALVSLGAAGLAAIWFFTELVVPAAVVLAALAVYGLTRHLRGRAVLERDPVAGRNGYEYRVLWLLVLSTLVGAAILIVGAELPEFKDEPEKKAVVTGAVGAITALLAAVFVDPVNEDGDDFWVGHPFKSVFQKRFQQRFASDETPAGIAADLAVNDDDWPPSRGWSRESRRRRAEAVRDALKGATPAG